MSVLSDLAEVIFITEFDSDSNIANVGSITAWLEENLGLLNTLINTSFQGENPDLGLEEKAIYKLIYIYNYYSKQARNILRGIASTSGGENILSVADGDNRIQFVNKNEVGKTYRDLAKETKLQLDQLVAKYNIYSSKPLQVGGIEAAAESSLNVLQIDTQEQNAEELINTLAELSSNQNIPAPILDGGSDD